MEHPADYIANCHRFGVTPSAEDYAEYATDAEANAPDDDLDGEEF